MFVFDTCGDCELSVRGRFFPAEAEADAKRAGFAAARGQTQRAGCEPHAPPLRNIVAIAQTRPPVCSTLCNATRICQARVYSRRIVEVLTWRHSGAERFSQPAARTKRLPRLACV